MTNLAEHQLAPTYSRPSIHIISDIYDIYQVMDGPIILRRLAALMRSCVIQTAPTRNLNGGVSADQALRSYKWSYIRLAARVSRWQNLWSYWAIAVVLTLLGRTIFLLKPAENIAIFPFYAPRVVQMVDPQNNHKYSEIFNCLKSIHLSS